MRQLALDDFHGKPLSVEFKPGMAWALYSDEGPTGFCGQDMRMTCPHALLIVWDSDSAMREACRENAVGRNGSRKRLMWGVVGEYTAGGVFTVVDKRLDTPIESG